MKSQAGAQSSPHCSTPTSASLPVDARLDECRQAGAARFDPASFHYLERLSARATAGQGRVQQLLLGRLAQALTAFQHRFDHARAEAWGVLDRHLRSHPDAGSSLQRLYQSGDFRALARAIHSPQPGKPEASLAELVCQLNQDTAPGNPQGLADDALAQPELKTMRHFRRTWSALSVDKQLAQALEQPPRNAGPINSHSLVLRSLAMMRDISPDYLTRFTSYVDTLLRLDQQAGTRKPAAKSADAEPRTPKARKPGKSTKPAR